MHPRCLSHAKREDSELRGNAYETLGTDGGNPLSDLEPSVRLGLADCV